MLQQVDSQMSDSDPTTGNRIKNGFEDRRIWKRLTGARIASS